MMVAFSNRRMSYPVIAVTVVLRRDSLFQAFLSEQFV
jgi:hypothetical protein